MFKITAADLNNPSFNDGFQALMRLQLPVKVSWNISRIGRQIEKLHKELQPEFMKVIEPFLEKDEEGKLIPQLDTDTGHVIPGSFKRKKDMDMADYQKKIEEFMGLELEVDSNLVPLYELNNARLSPAVLIALAPVIDENLSERPNLSLA